MSQSASSQRRLILPYNWFPNANPDALESVLRRLTHSVERAPGGLVFGPPVHESTYRVSHLCDLADMPTLDSRWESVFGRCENWSLTEANIERFRLIADECIAQRDFRYLAWRTMHLDEEEDDFFGRVLSIHRDVLFPAFFAAYPAGRILAFSYQRTAALDGFLSVVNILTRARRVGLDMKKLLKSSGREPMAWVGLHHIVYFPWYAIFLAFAALYPYLHGFVASLRHQGFLIYLFPKGERFSEEEPAGFERTMPGLTMAKSDGVVDESGDVIFRKNPLGRSSTYSVDELQSYITDVVAKTEQTLHRFTDLSRYESTHDFEKDSAGNSVATVDLGFARNTLLTLFTLLRRTVTNTFESDTFDRTMTFYDIVDLHTSLISVNHRRAAREFECFMSRAYADGELMRKISTFPGQVGADLVRGLTQIRTAGSAAIASGILDGWNGGPVARPKRKNGVLTVDYISLDDYEATLLRALRNTKHGYETTEADLLATHTGVLDEDFPDYALLLMLGLLTDSSEYELLH
jgi:hypothetical protein